MLISVYLQLYQGLRIRDNMVKVSMAEVKAAKTESAAEKQRKS